MNETLSTFMKLAGVAIVVAALLWNKLGGIMAEIADKVAAAM